jgi:hypothetical protein
VRNPADCSCACGNTCANGVLRADCSCGCTRAGISEGGGCYCPLPCNNGGTQNADCSCSCPNACEDETPNKDDCSCGLGQTPLEICNQNNCPESLGWCVYYCNLQQLASPFCALRHSGVPHNCGPCYPQGGPLQLYNNCKYAGGGACAVCNFNRVCGSCAQFSQQLRLQQLTTHTHTPLTHNQPTLQLLCVRSRLGCGERVVAVCMQ